MGLDTQVVDAEQLIVKHLDLWTSAQTAKSTAGRGSNNKIELTGIKKLRELIFELAVRGKLVPQDPNDEPASGLLMQVAAEKKSKGLNFGSSRPGQNNSRSGQHEIPKSWVWTTLETCSEDIHYGFTASADQVVKKYRLLRITDIQNDSVDWHTVPGCIISDEQATKYLLRENDILIARTGGTIGKSYLVKSLNVDAVFASYLIRVKRLDSINSEYLKVYLGSRCYWDQLLSASSGTGQPNVNGNALKKLMLPLPPINEQRRVVIKVEELMALCDQLEQQSYQSIDAHNQLVDTLLQTLVDSANADELASNWQRLSEHFDILFTTEYSIDALKQTILQLAVMGKLVKQDPTDEPASELYAEITKVRERLVSEDGLKTSANELIDDDLYLSCPEGWKWVRLGNLAKFIDYRGKTPIKTDSGVRLITAKNIKYGYIDLNPEEYISHDDYKSWMTRGFPEVGDVLFTTEAPLGNVAKIELHEPFALAQRAICFQWHTKKISEFMLFQLISVPFQTQLMIQATGMTATGIKASRLKEIPVLLPPLNEQMKISNKINEIIGFCDSLKLKIKARETIIASISESLVESVVA